MLRRLQPWNLSGPGRGVPGHLFRRVDFLKANTKSLLDSNLTDGNFISCKGKDVVIVGGGDTGNDCIGCHPPRLQDVTAIEMMPKAPDQQGENNPWPQWPRVCKTDYGHEEAIAVFGSDPRLYQTTVKEFLPDEQGNLRAVKIVHLKPEPTPRPAGPIWWGDPGHRGGAALRHPADRRRLPGLSEVCLGGLRGGAGRPHQRQDRGRQLPHQCGKGVYRRRYAPGPVPGGVGAWPRAAAPPGR